MQISAGSKLQASRHATRKSIVLDATSLRFTPFIARRNFEQKAGESGDDKQCPKLREASLGF